MYKHSSALSSLLSIIFLSLFILGSIYCIEFEYETVVVDSETHETKIIPESKDSAFEVPNVISINSKAHLSQVFNSTRYVIVDFFSTNCRACIKSFPVYTQFANYVAKEHVHTDDPEKKQSIAVASVNCDKLSSLCTALSINSYPTINLYENGQFEIIYYKVAEFEEMKRWLNNFISPSLTEKAPLRNRAALDEEIRRHAHRVHGVLFWNDRKDANYLSIVKQLKSLKVHQASIDEIQFHEVIGDDKAINAFHEGARSGDLIIYQPHSMERQVRKTFSRFVREDRKILRKFLKKYALPLIPRLRNPVIKQYRDDELPLVTVYLTSASDAHKTQMYELLEGPVKQWKGRVNFGYLSGSKWKNNIEQQGGSWKSLPHITFYHPERDLLYVFRKAEDNKRELTPENVAQWIEAVIKSPHKVSAFYFSLPIPESDDEPVKTVVSKSVDDIVFKEGQDVLLVIFSKWSGLSSGFLPVMDRVAQYVSTVGTMVVGKMDDRNQHPKIPRMLPPAIVLVDSKNRLHKYSDKMDAEHVIRFVKRWSVASKRALRALPKFNPLITEDAAKSDAPAFEEEDLKDLHPFGGSNDVDQASQKLWDTYFGDEESDVPDAQPAPSIDNLFTPDREDGKVLETETVDDEKILSKFDPRLDILEEVALLAKSRQEILAQQEAHREEIKRKLKEEL